MEHDNLDTMHYAARPTGDGNVEFMLWSPEDPTSGPPTLAFSAPPAVFGRIMGVMAAACVAADAEMPKIEMLPLELS